VSSTAPANTILGRSKYIHSRKAGRFCFSGAEVPNRSVQERRLESRSLSGQTRSAMAQAVILRGNVFAPRKQTPYAGSLIEAGSRQRSPTPARRRSVDARRAVHLPAHRCHPLHGATGSTMTLVFRGALAFRSCRTPIFAPSLSTSARWTTASARQTTSRRQHAALATSDLAVLKGMPTLPVCLRLYVMPSTVAKSACRSSRNWRLNTFADAI